MKTVPPSAPAPVAGDETAPESTAASGAAPRPQRGPVIKVFIVDDHPVVRIGLRQCISENPDMEVAGEAGAAPAVLDFMGHGHCDVLLLDITLPGQSGLDILRILKKNHPRLPVLILTMFPEDPYAILCLRAGAAGFLSKTMAPDLLADAIRKVARGGRYVSPELAETLAFEENDPPLLSPHKALSGREFQIFRQLANGRSQKAIAEELKLSAKTVSTHRTRLLKKMHMRCNADIVRYALTHQLIS